MKEIWRICEDIGILFRNNVTAQLSRVGVGGGVVFGGFDLIPGGAGADDEMGKPFVLEEIAIKLAFKGSTDTQYDCGDLLSHGENSPARCCHHPLSYSLTVDTQE